MDFTYGKWSIQIKLACRLFPYLIDFFLSPSSNFITQINPSFNRSLSSFPPLLPSNLYKMIASRVATRAAARTSLRAPSARSGARQVRLQSTAQNIASKVTPESTAGKGFSSGFAGGLTGGAVVFLVSFNLLNWTSSSWPHPAWIRLLLYIRRKKYPRCCHFSKEAIRKGHKVHSRTNPRAKRSSQMVAINRHILRCFRSRWKGVCRHRIQGSWNRTTEARRWGQRNCHEHI